jgi:cellulose biosynthesis protein BcsQ
MPVKQIRVLLVDTDEKYLMPLERKFIDGFKGNADINVITDKEFLHTFFAAPQKLDILVINQDLYDQSFERHDIANVFFLTEQMTEDSSTGNLNNNCIYKYTSVKEIFNEVINNSTSITTADSQQTQVIFVYSPIGGVGCTSVAMALSAALTRSYKKVLFMSMDSLQTFGFLLPDCGCLPSEVETQMISGNEHVYDAIKSGIFKGDFDYLPPFRLSLPALNITPAHYLNLLNSIKSAGEYDYVVLDSDSSFSPDMSKLMSYANFVVIVSGQDDVSAYKLARLLANIDCSDENKFLFVCNRYRNAKENALTSNSMLRAVKISAYLDYLDSDKVLEQLAVNRNVQKLAMMFI